MFGDWRSVGASGETPDTANFAQNFLRNTIFRQDRAAANRLESPGAIKEKQHGDQHGAEASQESGSPQGGPGRATQGRGIRFEPGRARAPGGEESHSAMPPQRWSVRYRHGNV